MTSLQITDRDPSSKQKEIRTTFMSQRQRDNHQVSYDWAKTSVRYQVHTYSKERTNGFPNYLDTQAHISQDRWKVAERSDSPFDRGIYSPSCRIVTQIMRNTPLKIIIFTTESQYLSIITMSTTASQTHSPDVIKSTHSSP